SGSSSASSGPPRPGTTAAWAWASTSPARWWRRTEGPSGWPATPAPAPRSPSSCRSRPRAGTSGRPVMLPSSNSRARRILVVDDDPDLAEVLDRVLEKSGYLVTWAKNGQEALRCLRDETDLDVVLLDLMMPVMNGWEFRAEQLKDPSLSKIPVV